MEQKKGFSARLEAFFAGKGFYIVLLLSAAVIGISIWMAAAGRADVEDGTGEGLDSMAQADVGGILTGGGDDGVQTGPTDPETAGELPVMAQAPEVAQTLPGQPTLGGDTAGQEEPTAFVWPVSGTVERGYSVEALSYDRTLSDWRTHEGWDIAAQLGAPVLAAGPGEVTAVYEDALYGMVVEIRHGGGLQSVYANLAAQPTVQVGDPVNTGSVIGAVGDTALCEIGEGSHLHFAMRQDGQSADPAGWLPAQ